MLIPAVRSGVFGWDRSPRRQLYAGMALSLLTIIPLFVWFRSTRLLRATSFLPHLYCYLGNGRLIWTNVLADTLIGVAYFAISVTLAYLVYKARRDIPFHWMFLAFGLFIIACGGTHFMEVITIWVPAYLASTSVKIFTGLASLTTAAVLPFTVPKILTLVQQAKFSEQVTAKLRASEERKEALLREVHHRVKNNLAVICSLFYLQSTHSKNEKIAEIFAEMENRVHSMALVHESLYRSDNLARVDFAKYAKNLADGILTSHANPNASVSLKTDLEPVTVGIDLAVPCGLVLNELISNAFKHGFPDGKGGEIHLKLQSSTDGQCTMSVEDTGVGLPDGMDIAKSRSLGLKLVRLLTQQIRGSFELSGGHPGTLALLKFKAENHER